MLLSFTGLHRAGLACLAVAAGLAVGANVQTARSQPAVAPSHWSAIAPMPIPQVEAGAAELDGKIYVMGGWSGDGVASTMTQVYDIAANTWRAGSPLPQPMHHQGVVATGGKIYVVGGFGKVFAEREPLAVVHVFDPKTQGWTPGAPMSAPRGAGVVAAIGTTIYYAGGERKRVPGGPAPKPGANAVYEPVTDFAAYDIATNTWKQLPPLKIARDHLMGGVIDGKFYVVGGRDRPVYDLTAVEIYDPATGAWTTGAPMLVGRSGGAAAVLGGKLYVFGGEGNNAVPSGVFPQADAFDPRTNAWTAFADMPLPRHSIVAVPVAGKIYLPGGAVKRGGGDVTGDGDAFAPD